MTDPTQPSTPESRPDPRVEPLAEWAAERLTAWAGCVQRLIAVAPTRAVMDETGIVSEHTTPPERTAIREKARATVASWLARDLAEARSTPYPPTMLTADEAASIAHDFIYGQNDVTQQQASDAIWTSHSDVSADLRAALEDANRIVAMMRAHLTADHPDCAYAALGVLRSRP